MGWWSSQEIVLSGDITGSFKIQVDAGVSLSGATATVKVGAVRCLATSDIKPKGLDAGISTPISWSVILGVNGVLGVAAGGKTVNVSGRILNANRERGILKGAVFYSFPVNLSYTVAAGRAEQTSPCRVDIIQGLGNKKAGTVNFRIPAKPSYTVSYNANGGANAPASQTKWYGEELRLQTAKPNRSGHRFLGWATSPSGKVSYAPGASYTANSALTLYAVWEQMFTVSYNANGGSGAPAAQTKYANSALALSTAVPTREGHRFLGWAESATAQAATRQPGQSYTENRAVTLYAVWELLYSLSMGPVSVARVNDVGAYDDFGDYVAVRGTAVVEGSEPFFCLTEVTAGGRVYSENVDSGIFEHTPGKREEFAWAWMSRADKATFDTDHQHEFRATCSIYRYAGGKAESIEVKSWGGSSALPSRITGVADGATGAHTQISSRVELPRWAGKAPVSAEAAGAEAPDGLTTVAHSRFDLDEGGAAGDLVFWFPYSGVAPAPMNDCAIAATYDDGRVESTRLYDRIAAMKEENPLFPAVKADGIWCFPYGFDPATLAVPAEGAAKIEVVQDQVIFLGEGVNEARVTWEIGEGEAVFTLAWADDAAATAAILPAQYRLDLVYPDAPVPQTGNLLQSRTATAVLAVAEYVLDFHSSGKGAAIGGVAPERGIDIGWDTAFKGRVLDLFPPGYIYISSQPTSPAQKFGGLWIEIKNEGFLRLAGNFSAGGSNSRSLAAANIPSHVHTVPAHGHAGNAVNTGNQSGGHYHYTAGASGYGAARMNNLSDDIGADIYNGSLSGSGYKVFRRKETTGLSYVRDTGSGLSASHHHSVTTSVKNCNAFNTQATGSGTAFDITPKYQNVYAWRRATPAEEAAAGWTEKR